MTEENIKTHFNLCKETLKKFITSGNYLNNKKSTNFLNWTSNKAEKVATENHIEIPHDYMPKKINKYEYNRLDQEAKRVVDSYYKKLDEKGKTIYKKNKSNIETIKESEIKSLVYAYVFKRGKVVWVDFGYNIGCEFGGCHPAIILKKSGENLIVIPLSSYKANETINKANYIIQVPNVYGLKKSVRRWTSVHRMATINPKRIIFSNHGSVKSSVLDEISKAIKSEF